MMHLWTTFVFVSCFGFKIAVSSANFKSIPVLNDNMCATGQILFNETKRSILECQVRCVEATECRSTFFDTQPKRCIGCDVAHVGPLNLGTKPGTIYFGKEYCPPYWTEVDKSCYQLRASPMTHQACVTGCQSVGGYIATFESIREAMAMFEYMRELATVTGNYFFGLYDVSLGMNQWQWETGLAMTFSAWCPAEPDGPHEHCGVINSTTLCWDDLDCGRNELCLCERDAV